MKIKNAFSVLFAVALFFFCVVHAHAQVTAIKAGKLVDTRSGTVTTNQIIIIEGERIKALGVSLQIPANATIVDLSNSSVLPGLFDVHTHLCIETVKERDLGNYYFTTLLDTNAYRAIIGVANARSMLEAGFTTVRDLGNAGNYVDSDLRRAISEGKVPGPTIINAGRIITPYGGQFHLQPERRDLGEPEYLYADSHDEMRKAIRENIHYGALVIKIVVDDHPYIYSADDIKFIVEEAAKSGLGVAAHCVTDKGARNAIEGGVASIEHGNEMTDDTMRLAKKMNVMLVPTPLTEASAREIGLPDPKGFHLTSVSFLKRARSIDVAMAYGVDVLFGMKDQSRGTLCMSALDNYVEAGMPAKAILQMMTINSAQLLGVEKARGEIKVGQAADIIATPGNPLDNILTLKHISFVMKGGKVFKQTK